MNYTLPATPGMTSVVTLVAQAYGTDSYNTSTYNGDTTTAVTAPPSGPSAPQTGYFTDPPLFTFPLLLGVAIVVGSLSFVLSRILRRRRK